jgi:hypothetical protein
VQEWKNILIRGNQEQEFSRYEKAFLPLSTKHIAYNRRSQHR